MASCINRQFCYSAQEHCYSPRMWGHVCQIFWLLESNKNTCFLCEIAWFLVLLVNLHFKKTECQIDCKDIVNLILYTANSKDLIKTVHNQSRNSIKLQGQNKHIKISNTSTYWPQTFWKRNVKIDLMYCATVSKN